MIFIPQLISLDYDHTFTADPELWLSFIQAAEFRGHTVIVVTWRSDKTPVEGIPSHIKVYYTNMELKKAWCKIRGISPTIWSDDMPETIT